MLIDAGYDDTEEISQAFFSAGVYEVELIARLTACRVTVGTFVSGQSKVDIFDPTAKPTATLEISRQTPFALFLRNRHNQFFSDSEMNPDGKHIVRVLRDTSYPDQFLIGFEDSLKGDRDFQDMVIRLTRTTEPHLEEFLSTICIDDVVPSNLETFPAGSYVAELLAEFTDAHAKTSLDRYSTGGESSSVVFDGSHGNFGLTQKKSLVSFQASTPFGLNVTLTDGTKLFTEDALNPDGGHRARVLWDKRSGSLLIGFDDFGDGDFQDLVVRLDRVIVTPSLMWQEPWKGEHYVLPDSNWNFGQSAGKRNGQITDLGARGDTGAATAVLRTDVLIPGGQNETTGHSTSKFSRSFFLEGSPGGWTVRLEGTLKGELAAGGKRTKSKVEADAQIYEGSSESLNFEPRLSFHHEIKSPGKKGETNHLIVDDSDVVEVILKDGLYTIRCSAEVEPKAVGKRHGHARANFFSWTEDSGLRIEISATPESP